MSGATVVPEPVGEDLPQPAAERTDPTTVLERVEFDRNDPENFLNEVVGIIRRIRPTLDRRRGRKTAMGEGADEGTLMISWIAQDRNIADKPISLYYQTKDGTTWAPIAKGLAQGKPVATEGSYRWKLPANLGSELTIRLDAVDRAGNVGSAVSGTVHLDRYGGGIRVIGVRSGQ